jgi:hypothetical protein
MRSHEVTDNSTLSAPQPVYDSESIDDSFDDRHFHAPATVPNDYLEAICGNLTLM